MRYKNKAIETENFVLKSILVACALIGSFTLGSMLDTSELELQQQEDKFYHEMVCLFQETEGEFGWPNYRRQEVTCIN